MSAKPLTPEEWEAVRGFLVKRGRDTRLVATLDAARERIEELEAAIRRIEDAPGVVSDEVHEAIENAIRVVGDARGETHLEADPDLDNPSRSDR